MGVQRVAMVITQTKPELIHARLAGKDHSHRQARHRPVHHVPRANIKINLLHKLMGASRAAVDDLPIRQAAQAARRAVWVVWLQRRKLQVVLHAVRGNTKIKLASKVATMVMV